MTTTLHFVSGLPRSGSTLLCNVLAQNPRFHATATSGLLDLLFAVRTQWNLVPELRHEPDETLRRVMAWMLVGFHPNAGREVVFDKCRGWTSEIELLENVLRRQAKIIVPVRDVRDVLASLEKLYRRNVFRAKSTNSADYLQCQTVEGRCHFWLRHDQPLGIAYGRIVDAMARGFKDRLHFVHFERFTAQPMTELAAIYAFLGEPHFAHDVRHVEQVTSEDDSVYGMGDLHTIRPQIEPSTPQWPTVLGPFAEQFGQLNFPVTT